MAGGSAEHTKPNYGALAAVAIPIGALLAFLYLQEFNPRLLPVSNSAQFQRACVKAVAERLKSPSSMKVVEVTAADEPIKYSENDIAEMSRELEELDAIDVTAASEERRLRIQLEQVRLVLKLDSARKSRTGRANPTLFKAFVTYDADNSFGAAIRGVAECEFASNYGDFDGSDARNILVDGETNFDWTMNQYRAASETF